MDVQQRQSSTVILVAHNLPEVQYSHTRGLFHLVETNQGCWRAGTVVGLECIQDWCQTEIDSGPLFGVLFWCDTSHKWAGLGLNHVVSQA